jgi:hypothetical protein
MENERKRRRVPLPVDGEGSVRSKSQLKEFWQTFISTLIQVRYMYQDVTPEVWKESIWWLSRKTENTFTKVICIGIRTVTKILKVQKLEKSTSAVLTWFMPNSNRSCGQLPGVYRETLGRFCPAVMEKEAKTRRVPLPVGGQKVNFCNYDLIHFLLRFQQVMGTRIPPQKCGRNRFSGCRENRKKPSKKVICIGIRMVAQNLKVQKVLKVFFDFVSIVFDVIPNATPPSNSPNIELQKIFYNL